MVFKRVTEALLCCYVIACHNIKKLSQAQLCLAFIRKAVKKGKFNLTFQIRFLIRAKSDMKTCYDVPVSKYRYLLAKQRIPIAVYMMLKIK